MAVTTASDGSDADELQLPLTLRGGDRYRGVEPLGAVQRHLAEQAGCEPVREVGAMKVEDCSVVPF